MRIALLTLFTALLGLAAVAQNASPSLGCAPLEVDFSPPDGGQAFWNFGDGASSSISAPSHLYTSPGVYTVTFSRTDGGTTVGSVTVTVLPKPTISLTIDDNEGCVPHAVQFVATANIDPSITINTINWAYGDGQGVLDGGTSVRHIYRAGGSYDVTVDLETSQSGCNTAIAFTDTIQAFALPVANFNRTPAQSCDVPLSVSITNNSTGAAPLSYDWDFGNGEVSAIENPPNAIYGAAGDYSISLTVTDGNGCVSTPPRVQTVSAGPPSANFDLPDTVCFNVPYTVRALGSSISYDWTYGPNVSLIEDLGPTQEIIFTSPGLTTVALAVANADCAGDTTRNIFVQQLIADATSDPNYFCETPYTINYTLNNPASEIESVAWVFPFGEGGSTANNPTVTYEYDKGGEYGQNWLEYVRASVLIISPQGCRDSIVISDVIDIPNALFIPDVHNGCAPLEVTFADSIRSNPAVTQVNVDWGDGTVEMVSTTGPWTHIYANPGEYEPYMWMENAQGCRDTSYSISIEVGALIGNLTYTTDASPACPGDTLTFTNTTTDARIDNVHFEVEGGSSFHCANNNTLQHVLTNTVEGATLDLTLYVEYNGCIDSLTEAIPYASAPLADLNYLIECDAPYDVRFYNDNTRSTSDSLYIYAETPGTYRDSFTITDSLDLTLPARGVYQAVIVAIDPSSACGSDRDTVEFYITEPIAAFDLDTLFCSGAPLILDGSTSQDVNATCSKGYQWEFTWDRPYTSSRSSTGMDVQANGRGDETVSLIVEDINGCTDTLTRDVRIFVSEVTVTASKTRICLPSTVNFTANPAASDTTILTYDWNFGGYGTSTDQNPTFTFPNDPNAPDVILVTLMTNDALNCPASFEIPLQVYRPISNVTVDKSAICEGESITFSATDFTAEGNQLFYDWDFGNGTMGSAFQQTVTYNTAGTYTVTLNYQEDVTLCAGDTTLFITVEGKADPMFTSDVDGQTVLCFPQPIVLTDVTSSSFPYTGVWSINGELQINAIDDPVLFTGNSLVRGLNEITLETITNGAGCRDTLTREFTLVGPEGDFNFSPGVICQGETVNFSLRDTLDVDRWTWDFGNGITEDDTDPTSATYTVAPMSGTTVVSLTLFSDGDECSFVVTDTLRFLEIEANFTTDLGSDFACDPTVMFIDASSGGDPGSYLYDFGNGDTSTETSPTYTFPSPGEYEITLSIATAGGECVDTTRRTITVLAPLDLQVTVDSACFEETIDITVSTSRILLAQFFDPQSLIAFSDSNVHTTVDLSVTQNISLSVLDTFGCEEEILDIELFVAEGFVGEGDTIVILSGSSTTLEIENTGGFIFDWTQSPPPAEICDDCSNPVVMPDETQDYLLIVTDPTGDCTNDSILFVVIVVEEPVVPNLFSPNNDGTNDSWGPLFPEGITPTADIYQVYNRWGALVFESEDPNEKWTGDKNGSGEAPSDVYAYVINFVYPDGSEFKSAGEITLIR